MRKKNILVARVPSDPMKRLRWGITGDLLGMRNDALARIKVACDSYGTITTNVATHLDAVCKAGHVAESVVPPEMTAWARQFKDTLSKLNNVIKKDVATWTLSSAPAHLEKGHTHDLRTGPGCHVYGGASEGD